MSKLQGHFLKNAQGYGTALLILSAAFSISLTVVVLITIIEYVFQ